MRLLSGRQATVIGIGLVVVLTAVGALWRLGLFGAPSASSIVPSAPAGLPARADGQRQIVAAYGMPIGYGDGKSHVLDPTSGEYRSVAGNLHTVSPDLRWAVLSVERIGESPQVFDFWLYDTVAGSRGKHLGRLPFTHVRWSGDGRWLSFARVKHLNKQDSCVDQVRFVEVATGRSNEVPLTCELDRVVPLGWSIDNPGLVLPAGRDSFTVVSPKGEVATSTGTPAIYGPHQDVDGSFPRFELGASRVRVHLVDRVPQVFVAPASALPTEIRDKAIQALPE